MKLLFVYIVYIVYIYTMKKTASEIVIGDIIISPHTSSFFGIVDKITQSEKKINFHITFLSKENKDEKWVYTFLKTTKVKIK